MSSKIRVAFIIGQLGFGGAERQLSLLVSALASSKFVTPIVICTSNNIYPFANKIKESGVIVCVYDKPFGGIFQKILWVIQQNRSFQIQIIVGFLNTGNIYAGVTSYLLKIPLIATIRSADSTLNFWISALSGYFCNRAEIVIANSISCANVARTKLGIKHDRVMVIKNGIDVSAINPIINQQKIDKLNVPPNKKIIGTLANLKIAKRPDFFIDTCLELVKLRAPDFVFVWVGDGPERSSIEKRLRDLPEEYRELLFFIGATENAYGILKQFDIFVLTSEYEGSPNSLLEAMSVGLPCVATNVPGTCDISSQDESEVLLTDPESPEAMAKKISELLEDIKLRQNLGGKARKLIEKEYSIDKMVKSYEVVFMNIKINLN